jgi:hypothetical protein
LRTGFESDILHHRCSLQSSSGLIGKTNTVVIASVPNAEIQQSTVIGYVARSKDPKMINLDQEPVHEVVIVGGFGGVARASKETRLRDWLAAMQAECLPSAEVSQRSRPVVLLAPGWIVWASRFGNQITPRTGSRSRRSADVNSHLLLDRL